MVFVFITMACNTPSSMYGGILSFFDEDTKYIWKKTNEEQFCSKDGTTVGNIQEDTTRFWFDQLQYFQVILILIYILNDPFTYRFIKTNVLGCNSKSRKNKKKMQGNLQ